MKNIAARQFCVLGDCGKIYDFMLGIYERDWRNGVPAPFFEYAFSSFSYWMDITYSYRDRIWEDNGEIVAFCFYESPMTDIYFSLKPGYEELAPEMIAYADGNMAPRGGEIQAVIANEEGEYVCYAGMWWTPANKLAYMEPLCTIPEYRHRGLAAAALSQLYRKMKPLGATHMTGGGNEFYRKIGYEPAVKWTYWKRRQK